MCTVATHPVVPIALSVFIPPEIASPSLLLAGSLCSVVPDLDVIGFQIGVRYEDMFGHRGFTHSIAFAVALATGVTASFFSGESGQAIIFLFLLISTLSHPLLDALTDGGLGVGFFAPFNNRRYFFPFRPIKVSPMGLHAVHSVRMIETLKSELRWVWLPAAVLFAFGKLYRSMQGG
jgi:inner membrane protein